MVKIKLDGTVEELTADQEIGKFNAIVHKMVKNLEAYTLWNQVLWQAGWQSIRQNLGED